MKKQSAGFDLFKNPLTMFKTIINIGNVSMVETMLTQQNVDLLKCGPELLAFATL